MTVQSPTKLGGDWTLISVATYRTNYRSFRNNVADSGFT